MTTDTTTGKSGLEVLQRISTDLDIAMSRIFTGPHTEAAMDNLLAASESVRAAIFEVSTTSEGGDA